MLCNGLIILDGCLLIKAVCKGALTETGLFGNNEVLMIPVSWSVDNVCIFLYISEIIVVNC